MPWRSPVKRIGSACRDVRVVRERMPPASPCRGQCEHPVRTRRAVTVLARPHSLLTQCVPSMGSANTGE